MIEGILAALALLKPLLLPLMTFLAGWLFPSPLQKAKQGQVEVHDAESKATASRGDVSDLDNLP